MLRGVAAYLRDLTRFFSSGQFIHKHPMSPTNGLLQGDPLSVLLCCVCVQSWKDTVQTPELQIQAYIDDRTLAAPTLDALLYSWKRSKEWDRDNKWQVNMKKTHVLMVGDRASRQWEESGEDELSRSESIVCSSGRMSLLISESYPRSRGRGCRLRWWHATSFRDSSYPLSLISLPSLLRFSRRWPRTSEWYPASEASEATQRSHQGGAGICPQNPFLGCSLYCGESGA